ncbi:UNVERIFIED_CONTAM: hypothetical protein GTU68_029060 [Idotea baltica]|nr:hypothetical protein [Idotea baltica]
MKIGLYFGSFNPIHYGHLNIAEEIYNHTDLDEIQFVVSPQNPHKKITELISIKHRIKMVEIATKNCCYINVNKIETTLPKPSYTYDTLQALKKLHPTNQFSIIMGDDNLVKLDSWKESTYLKSHYKFYVYPRHNETQTIKENENIEFLKLPKIEISSTSIRTKIRLNNKYQFVTHPEVVDYIKQYNLFS